MLIQDQALPFDSRVIFSVPMLFYWIVAFLFCIILIEAKLMTRRISLFFYFITVLICGLLLGGIPNSVMPIQQILITLSEKSDLSYLLPAMVVLTILLSSSLIVGRIFCGYLCPLGALQELLSTFKFKRSIKDQEKVRYFVSIQSTSAGKIRWLFFGGLFALAAIGGTSLLQLFNPLMGFVDIPKIFKLLFTIPIITMIGILAISFFIYRPWCRLFCPFGAGSAFCSRFTRTKYIRTEKCIECGDCERICPTQEAVVTSKKQECYFCNRCLEVCPMDAILLNLEEKQ